jgi:hypothetical protein
MDRAKGVAFVLAVSLASVACGGTDQDLQFGPELSSQYAITVDDDGLSNPQTQVDPSDPLSPPDDPSGSSEPDLPVENTCGDGTCTSGEESCSTCPADCGSCPKGFCGDGVCSGMIGEYVGNCPDDCPGSCGDGICHATESCCDCCEDCCPSPDGHQLSLQCVACQLDDSDDDPVLTTLPEKDATGVRPPDGPPPDGFGQ